ncbi:hypothetical protein RhiirA1_483537 [Rhizophagus irregularis]|uniref:Uncharacterized protein n=1 Tax=Rhizophagus irregularis TaxID=588596 RepID=A0A2N0QKF6_9GLOM|nr:hypothetical protein RhiirA1_483537 [Rhizophagus irregularis]
MSVSPEEVVMEHFADDIAQAGYSATKGSLELQTKWQEINLDPDHCLYIPPKCDHNYRSVDRNEFLILDIPSQYLPEDTSNMYIQVDEQWASIRYLLLEESRNKASTAALVDLTREPITLETLANIEHYHPVYYSSWFKKQTGKSPKVL